MHPLGAVNTYYCSFKWQSETSVLDGSNPWTLCGEFGSLLTDGQQFTVQNLESTICTGFLCP